jgi:hypothetical protein
MLHHRLSIIHFEKIEEFLKNGTVSRSPSNIDLHILSGWKISTLKSYNSAVIKYMKFAVISGHTNFTLPLSPREIEDFCLWAGRSLFSRGKNKISTCSLKK